MELNLKGHTAVVTGASKGIGRAVAAGLAAEGCNLHIVARNRNLLDQLAAELATRHSVSVQAHSFDLGERAAATELAAATGAVDILVNNAGAIPRGSLDDVDDETMRTGWELKVFGYIRLCRAYYPLMRERRSGVIVNVIGAAGQRPDANYIAPTSANAALMMFTQSLGGESVGHGVRVVGVNPGLVATDRFKNNIRKRAAKKFGDEERWPEFFKDLPIGRVASPEEIADVIIFLASSRASYVSGTVVTADGGLMARPPASL